MINDNEGAVCVLFRNSLDLHRNKTFKMVVLCPICYRAAFSTLKKVVSHIGLVHSFDADFHIICGVAGCPRTYTNFLSYKKHMYRKHKLYLESTEAEFNSFDQGIEEVVGPNIHSNYSLPAPKLIVKQRNIIL